MQGSKGGKFRSTMVLKCADMWTLAISSVNFQSVSLWLGQKLGFNACKLEIDYIRGCAMGPSKIITVFINITEIVAGSL